MVLVSLHRRCGVPAIPESPCVRDRRGRYVPWGWATESQRSHQRQPLHRVPVRPCRGVVFARKAAFDAAVESASGAALFIALVERKEYEGGPEQGVEPYLRKSGLQLTGSQQSLFLEQAIAALGATYTNPGDSFSVVATIKVTGRRSFALVSLGRETVHYMRFQCKETSVGAPLCRVAASTTSEPANPVSPAPGGATATTTAPAKMTPTVTNPATTTTTSPTVATPTLKGTTVPLNHAYTYFPRSAYDSALTRSYSGATGTVTVTSSGTPGCLVSVNGLQAGGTYAVFTHAPGVKEGDAATLAGPWPELGTFVASAEGSGRFECATRPQAGSTLAVNAEPQDGSILFSGPLP